MVRRLIITGSEGLIGRNLLEKLDIFGQNIEIHAVDARPALQPKNLSVTNHCLDLTKVNILKLLESIDPHIVIHLAAQTDVRTSILKPHFDKKINFETTKGIVDALETLNHTSHLVFANSGGAVYGDVQIGRALRESDERKPTSPYGKHKLEATNYLKLISKNSKVTCGILNFSNIYGSKYDQKSAPYKFMNQVTLGKTLKVYGDGESVRDWIHVDDAVNAIILATKKISNLEVNISTGVGTSIKSLLKEIQACTSLTMKVENLPLNPGEVRHSVLDSTLARIRLGWEPLTSLRDGLKKMHVENYGQSRH